MAKPGKSILTNVLQVIQTSSRPPVSVLDNRAATYEKLGRLKAALQDGKRIIEEQKSEARGYLRVGKILQMMDKKALAQEIYGRGLLVAMHNKQLGSQTRSSVDPIMILPAELFYMVAALLKPMTLVVCLRVSKKWHDHLNALTSLWTVLDLSLTGRPIRNLAFRACIKRAQGRIGSATLNHSTLKMSHPLRLLTSNCRNLKYLDLREGFKMMGSILEAMPHVKSLNTLLLPDCEITFEGITRILGTCKCLCRAEFGTVCIPFYAGSWPTGLTNLRTLRLNIAQPSELDGVILKIDDLVERAPNITELILTGWGGIPSHTYSFSKFLRLESLDLSRNLTNFFPELPPSIRSLNISHRGMLRPVGFLNLQNMEMANLVSLERLRMENIDELAVSSLIKLLRPSIGVRKSLSIAQAAFMDTATMVELARSGVLADVTELSVAGTFVDDDGIIALTSASPNLIRLDLSSTNVSGISVKALVIRPEMNLKWLGLTHCASVSPDAVELARSKGVVVDYQMAERSKSGKKVRYL
ncbi:MAG: hypothetical protein M1837_007075 [Sclerophora amabilis]|nr:MAG: hypothetical protein M1837_007075 [Sclerophora amabilis]